MYINATGFYIPEARVDNQHFLELNGLTSEWIEQRTGIRTRSIAKPEENINTMSMEALRNALPQLPYDITEVDLIISASYSPYDTVATAAHNAQFEFNITNAKALYLSSACSSFINALEVVEGYFAMGKASKALILGADKNSAYWKNRSESRTSMGRCRCCFLFIQRTNYRKRCRSYRSIYTGIRLFTESSRSSTFTSA